ncbi:proton-associated sugar transporter A [Eupeodes corollae]|uniref:proton-associated sugar transporter A n=1 Tax=Eupeodes corollae TaxID=290404 RepID=UPI00248F502E|nr:proton-associated sugar transporter A [Eupeodes corollae]XP_055905349.1 proton-associated sugar transporter A [Eupeodes corollae]XP_055905350.1 proton-associated sugar transporter A [Eupeodes corollae]
MVGGAKVKNDHTTANDPMIKYMLKVREDHARQQKKDYSHAFRRKSRLDLIRLSALAVGIEFAYAAETAFVSPILLQIGINHKHMTMVWGLSPLLGFFLAPLLGSVSDRCQLSFGRRRPIISMLSFGIFLGLLLVPYGRDIGILLGDQPSNTMELVEEFITTDGVASAYQASEIIPPESGGGTFKFAVIFTILGTILLDFDADTCQTPSRAYLLDSCIPEDQPRALSTFTIMAGLGGTFGYAIGGIDWESTRIGSFMGGNIPTVFMLVTVCFLLCYLVTITSFREIPLPLMEKDELLKPLSAGAITKETSKNNNQIFYIKETTTLELKMAEEDLEAESNGTTNGNVMKYKPPNTADPEMCGVNERISLGQYLKSIVIMPKSMRILSLTNLLCWMGHVCYCLYFTDFVGEAVFNGDPNSPKGSEKYNLYEEGVRFGCWGMSIYALSCSVYSLTVEKLVDWFGLRAVYIGGILSYAIGMLILAIWPSKLGVLLLSTTAGVIYATLFTMPYILIAKYHATGCFKMRSGENVPLKQTRGLGTDIAIISSMVFVAQFIISLSIGSLVAWMATTSAILYAASVLSIGAAVSAMFVLYI